MRPDKKSPTTGTATRRDRTSRQPDTRVGGSGATAVAAAESSAANVAPLEPAEKTQLVKSLETGMRAVAEEFPSPEELDLFMACAEIRQRLKKQESPAHRAEALQKAVDSVKEAAEIEDGSRGYIDALKRVMAHALAGIHEAEAIENTRPDEFAQASAGDDFNQARPRKAARR